MGRSKRSPSLSDNEEKEESEIPEEIMMRAREQVAREFLEACGRDKAKRKVVEELTETVLEHNLQSDAADDDEEYETIEESENSTGDSDDDDHEDSSNECLEVMNEIREYPYEEDQNGEVGEKAFDDFLDLLLPEKSDASFGYRRSGGIRPKRKAADIFSYDTAQTLVLAYHHIEFAGSIYSSDWLTGNIRDFNCGPIKKPMLLMCLQAQLFYRADTATLGKIIVDFDFPTLRGATLNCFESFLPLTVSLD